MSVVALLFSIRVLHFILPMDARFWKGLAGALALHASVGIVLFLASPSPFFAARTSSPGPVWLDLDSPSAVIESSPSPSHARSAREPELPAIQPGGVRTASPHPAVVTSPSTMDSAGPVLHSGASGPDGIGPLDATGTHPASPPGTGSGSGQVGSGGRRRPIDTGLGRGLHWAMVGPAPSATAPPRPLSATGGLQEALDQHDRVIGLGFGGPASSAVRAAASNITAPRLGLATIEVVFNGAGKVQSARVLYANQDTAGWARVAADAQAMLSAASIRVPPQSGGLAVTLQVEARTQLPSGTKPGDGTSVHPTGLGLAGEFDLADLGATPTRNVSVRIVGERRL